MRRLTLSFGHHLHERLHVETFDPLLKPPLEVLLFRRGAHADAGGRKKEKSFAVSEMAASFFYFYLQATALASYWFAGERSQRTEFLPHTTLGRECNDRLGININTNRFLHFRPEW